MTISPYPKLRPEIDAAPAEQAGEAFYILYDRSGISPSRLLISPLGLLIAGRLDGATTVLDISDALSREFPGGVKCRDVEHLINALGDALFLEDNRFQDFQAQAARDFRASTLRPAASAGSAYEADPVSLADVLERMLREAPPPEEAAANAGPGFPKGMVIPHIDYLRGAAGYGQCYRELRKRSAPQTVVVIGTAHVPMQERYALCEMDFATPLGAVQADRPGCERVRAALSPHFDPGRDLLAHRSEHSIELQAVWLRHIYGPDIRIVPILAASLGEFIDGDRPPAEAAGDPVIHALAECLGEMSATGRVMLLASADLAHLGPRFGDAKEITGQLLAEAEEIDREYLAAVGMGAAAGLASLAQHGDRNHVCGSACIFTLGAALPGTRTRLLGYHQAVTPRMRQAVTYAGMMWE